MAENFSPTSLTLRISGLRPEVWLSVGAGFAREDVKSFVLSEGKAFVAEAIVNLQEICLKITGVAADRLLASHARQEVFRTLLAEPKIIAQMPEIKRLKRQRNFIARLDLAIQSGRLAFAHPEEEAVYEERLANPSPLRFELRALAQAYEAWLGEMNTWDFPLLLRSAIETLRVGWPSHLRMPQEICSLTVQTPESLEREFWDTLGQHVRVRHLDSFHAPEAFINPVLQNSSLDEVMEEGSSSGKTLDWQRWHTLDDAAEYLADQIAPQWKTLTSRQLAVLIPDEPSVRRSLKRALDARKIPLAEPRDPTQLRWDENLKWALLPLEVVAQNFERQKVISWLRGPGVLGIPEVSASEDHSSMPPEFSTWVSEINSRGIRNGLGKYAGGLLSGVHAELTALQSELGGKKTVQEFATLHLEILKRKDYVAGPRFWLLAFFENLWKILAEDMDRVGSAGKKAPLLFWLEKLGARVRESSPPVEKLKPSFGVSLYRLQQAPVGPVEQLWVLGLPAEGLSGEGIGDYWFSERDREVLATEFAVRSCSEVSASRLRVLKIWMSLAKQTVFLDSQYDEGGRERESILPILNQLMEGAEDSESRLLGLHQESSSVQAAPLGLIREPREMRAHPRFQQSYGALRPVQSQEVLLPPMETEGSKLPELTATSLDRYSRCSFQALAYHRWKLRDVREPDTELWPDVRGNILHEAVRILLGSVTPTGEFLISSRDALERAWRLRPPQGLIRNPRIEAYIQKRMTTVLDIFCDKELSYLKRSKASPVVLENMNLRLDYQKFSIIGQPDRVDQHADGLFVLDYKTSGTLPHGQDILELGYRLQLPFYAIALRRNSNQPILGVQFVELDKRGGRKSGIFFKKYNGKEPGCLTQVRSNSKSLISKLLPEGASPPARTKKSSVTEPQESPSQATDETWDLLEELLVKEGEAFVSGQFRAQPKLPKREVECNLCGVSDLCGYRRLSSLEVEQGGIS